MKVRERDHDLFLFVPDGEEVAPQISQSSTGVNDGDAVGIGEGDLQAGGVTAELLETSITDGDGSPRAVKFKLHWVIAGPLSSSSCGAETAYGSEKVSLVFVVWDSNQGSRI